MIRHGNGTFIVIAVNLSCWTSRPKEIRESVPMSWDQILVYAKGVVDAWIETDGDLQIAKIICDWLDTMDSKGTSVQAALSLGGERYAAIKALRQRVGSYHD